MKYPFSLLNFCPLGHTLQFCSIPFQDRQSTFIRNIKKIIRPVKNNLILHLPLHSRKRQESCEFRIRGMNYSSLLQSALTLFWTKETRFLQFSLIWRCSVIYFLRKTLKGWKLQGFCRCIELQRCTFLIFRSTWSTCSCAIKIFFCLYLRQ